ncbi:hypothetical protein GCM10009715_08650 [Paeniglutamicibacter psychrophenolicus]|uniref:ABC-type transport system involved in multi-copper enzyme maturation permease subunit n=1 Tax=Paeniglutamicibacter psychrophenolicus TaxID=257454 RepID=A0ABS4WFJ0_9MICC|nr:hypothetical protein [Paeniglutamicibacter psychrophenolicus]MBP2374967.1 ABC-type transport system involved in multi-copper enzyme maturation permease subunit [Paeniglutamicibacter psychrophenolicus]
MKTIDRVGAFSGAAFVLVVNISSALVGEGSSGADSRGQRVLDEQQRFAANPWTAVAFAMIFLALAAFMMFVGYLCSRVWKAGWLATTALIGGTLSMLAYLTSAAIVMTIFVLRADMSPELARALEDLDGAGHMMQLLTLGVFVLFASGAALVTHTLGRVLSWAGMAIGATNIVVLAATGLATNEEFFAWPFLLVLLWMVVISLRLGFARNRDTAPAAVAATAG